jgi:hypothetical protein
LGACTVAIHRAVENPVDDACEGCRAELCRIPIHNRRAGCPRKAIAQGRRLGQRIKGTNPIVLGSSQEPIRSGNDDLSIHADR